MLTNEHNPQQSLFEGHGQQSVVLPQIPQVSGVQPQSPSATYSNSSGEGSHAGIHPSTYHPKEAESSAAEVCSRLDVGKTGRSVGCHAEHGASRSTATKLKTRCAEGGVSSATDAMPGGLSAPPVISDICRNRHGGNPQSEAANVRVHPSKSELKTKILNFIRERVGSTTEEVATGLNLRYTTASGRISELRRDSALEDSGKTRPTSSGCAATVWTTKGTTK